MIVGVAFAVRVCLRSLCRGTICTNDTPASPRAAQRWAALTWQHTKVKNKEQNKHKTFYAVRLFFVRRTLSLVYHYTVLSTYDETTGSAQDRTARLGRDLQLLRSGATRTRIVALLTIPSGMYTSGVRQRMIRRAILLSSKIITSLLQGKNDRVSKERWLYHRPDWIPKYYLTSANLWGRFLFEAHNNLNSLLLLSQYKRYRNNTERKHHPTTESEFIF